MLNFATLLSSKIQLQATSYFDLISLWGEAVVSSHLNQWDVMNPVSLGKAIFCESGFAIPFFSPRHAP